MSQQVREHRIEYLPIAEVLPWLRNPKKHDVPGVIASLKQFGFVAPVVVDEGTHRLVAGHGRLEALAKMKSDGDAAPPGIKVQAGAWLLPVVRGITFDNPNQAEKYLLADNRLTELGGYDEQVLLEVLQEMEASIGLEAAGWTSDDVEDLLAAAGRATVPDTDPFLGGSNETEEEQQRRAALASDRAMKEVVLMFEQDAHATFMQQVAELREYWAVSTTQDVVTRAVQLAVEAQHLPGTTEPEDEADAGS